MDLAKHKEFWNLTFWQNIFWRQTEFLFSFHLHLTENLPMADLELGRWAGVGQVKVIPSFAVPSTPFTRVRLAVLDGFPRTTEAQRGDPSQLWDLDSSSTFWVSVLHRAVAYVILLNSEQVLGRVPAGRKYSINVSYHDDFRERQEIEVITRGRRRAPGLSSAVWTSSWKPWGSPECTTV